MLMILALNAALAGPHAEHAQLFGGELVSPPASLAGGRLPPPDGGPDMIVYGYQAYWDDDLMAVPWPDLTHIALFAASVAPDGRLEDLSRWDDAATAVALADPYGVRVHLCVVNFDPAELRVLLASPSARSTLIDGLVEQLAITGAHGVNIDFEGVPSDARDDLVTFTAELDAAVGEVVLASPAVDWSGAWDYSELTRHADLFIMGYGYHWSGSSQAGPGDPLFSGVGTPFASPHSLSWSVDDYVTWGADPSRVILGLPLYGYAWATATDAVPSDTLAGGEVVFWAEGQDAMSAHGRRWEPGTESPWYWTGSSQAWVGDEASLEARIAYVRDDTAIGGIGFWALHYDDDDPALWEMIHRETRFIDSTTGGTSGSSTGTGTGTGSGTGTGTSTGSGTGTGGTGTGTGGTQGGGAVPWVADAGLPFIAYVGDTVILSAVGSTVPAAGAQYEWAQRSGPPAALDSPGSVEPSFVVEAPGTHVFELRVGDGSTWSDPAASHVVVLDPASGQLYGDPGCGCGHDGGAWPTALRALQALARR
ncbi:MAG: hypothetical protein ACI9K2_000336 [Myxococcota bacterium]|jgi:hypothetical protein